MSTTDEVHFSASMPMSLSMNLLAHLSWLSLEWADVLGEGQIMEKQCLFCTSMAGCCTSCLLQAFSSLFPVDTSHRAGPLRWWWSGWHWWSRLQFSFSCKHQKEHACQCSLSWGSALISGAASFPQQIASPNMSNSSRSICQDSTSPHV